MTPQREYTIVKIINISIYSGVHGVKAEKVITSRFSCMKSVQNRLEHPRSNKLQTKQKFQWGFVTSL